MGVRVTRRSVMAAMAGVIGARAAESKLKVVVVGGHPGDPEYGCGGDDCAVCGGGAFGDDFVSEPRGAGMRERERGGVRGEADGGGAAGFEDFRGAGGVCGIAGWGIGGGWGDLLAV